MVGRQSGGEDKRKYYFIFFFYNFDSKNLEFAKTFQCIRILRVAIFLDFIPMFRIPYLLGKAINMGVNPIL